jgi:hypothetical protein
VQGLDQGIDQAVEGHGYCMSTVTADSTPIGT